jgi:hypothetical protein
MVTLWRYAIRLIAALGGEDAVRRELNARHARKRAASTPRPSLIRSAWMEAHTVRREGSEPW